MISETMELTKHENIWSMINKYEEAQKAIVGGYTLLLEAQKNMHIFTNYPRIGPDRHYSSISESIIKEVLLKMKVDAWEGILKKTQAKNFMTTKRYDSFQKELESPDKLPDITFESVKSFVENILNKAPDMLMEFIKETFTWLQPRNYGLEYKTNKKSQYEIGKKLIKYCLSPQWGGGMQVNYHYESNIKAMHNAFSLIDGKGIVTPGLDMASQINLAGNNKQTSLEMDYFKLKWYRNGNLHIEFKRLDLLQKLNQYAGENTLKPN